MSTIKLEDLLEDPSILFAQQTTEPLNCDELLGSLKDIIDPVIKENEGCVLDEIFIDGLDATQVWGQVKLVNEQAERNVWADIEEFKANGLYHEDAAEEEAGEEEQEEKKEHVENDAGEAFGEMNDDEKSNEEFESEESDKEIEEDEDDAEVQISEAEVEANDDDYDDEEVEEGTEGEQHEDFGLNDEIFNLDDYKRQVLALEDEDDMDDDGEDVDLFADFSEEEDNDDDEMYTYEDFFDPSNSSKHKYSKGNKTGRVTKKNNAEKKALNEDEYDAAYNEVQADFYGNEDEEEEEEVELGHGDVKNDVADESKLSTYEKQQREIAQQIAELEAESIAEKRWTMKGEVSGKQRKADALLEEDLEFDRTAKPVPVITQETTETLEEIIKRRIQNQEFDEVQKRIISEMNNFKSSKKIEVSEEKSGKSLSELYEEEYTGASNEGENSELNAAHDEISLLFKDVTYQLDSLYSAHFVPKPKEKLIDVRIETSTIAMEDAQPLTMATGNSMAPQEIYKIQTKVNKEEVVLKSGVVMAKAELDRDDRQRLHRAKKRKQHLASKDESFKKKKVEIKQL